MGFMGLFVGWMALCVIVNLAILGFLGWAIYRLVKHFTK